MAGVFALYGLAFGANADGSLIFQGELVDQNGVGVPDGPIDIILKLYSDPELSAGQDIEFTENWLNASVFSGEVTTTSSSFPYALSYNNDINEGSLRVGQALYNTTKKDHVEITAVDTGINQITITKVSMDWEATDSITIRPVVKNGIILARIGSLDPTGNPISAVDFNQPLWLGIAVGTDTEMRPRLRIGVSPAAHTAFGVKTLQNAGVKGLSDGSIQVYSNGNESQGIRVDSTGNVGVGTTDPKQLLVLQGDPVQLLIHNTSANYNWQLGVGTSSNLTIRDATVGNNPFTIEAGAGADALYIKNGGNVGIGTTAPTSKLHVRDGSLLVDVAGDTEIGINSRATNNPYIRMALINTAGTPYGRIWTGDGLSWRALALQPSGGNVGIGTTAPQDKLNVAGDQISVSQNIIATGTYDWLALRSNRTIDDYGGLNAEYAKIYFVPNGVNHTRGDMRFALKQTGLSTVMNDWVTIQYDGNVGIGTTTPAAPLHVAGQCVTGDTLLKRRRKRKRKDKNGNLVEEDYFEDVRIDEIKSGDEILTLDEKSGKLVVSKVKALMDMGVKPIYTLTTASGKQIRTTGNHPYYIRSIKKYISTIEIDQSIRIEQLTRDTILGLGNKKMQFSMCIPRRLKRKVYEMFRIRGMHKKFAPILFGISIAHLIRKAQVRVSDIVIDMEYPGYEKEIQTLINELYPEIHISFKQIGKNSPAHEAAYFTFKGKARQDSKLVASEIIEMIQNKKDRRIVTPRVYEDSQPNRSVKNSIDQYKKLVKGDGEWIKVIDIQANMEIAVVGDESKQAVWDTIVKIEQTAPEQVYDIEVEGTHNFVGNGIIAHNTYINSTATTANIKGLEIDQSGAVSGTGYGLHVEKTGAGTTNVGGYFSATGATNNYGLIVESGNVGIGTTAPNLKLEIAGGQLGLDNNQALRFKNVAGTSVAGMFINTSDILEIGSSAGSSISGILLKPGAAEIMRITSAGNVGIGTTIPAAPLHVAGQCVTGDTLLKRRRKRKRKDENGNWIEEDYFEDARIDEIQSGDEILTLDERSGKLVVSKVKALMDMGVKPIYTLTTASGKQIRTTGNHPYFVRKRKQSKTYVFIDASNIIYGCGEAGWKMDYAKLSSYLRERFGASKLFFFGGLDNDNKKQLKFYELLQDFGYKLRLVPVKKFRDGNKKADADSRMTFELMKHFQDYDKVVVLTGDGDYFWVLEYLIKHGKELQLMSFGRRTASELKELAGGSFNELTRIKNLLEFVENKNGTDAFSFEGSAPRDYVSRIAKRENVVNGLTLNKKEADAFVESAPHFMPSVYGRKNNLSTTIVDETNGEWLKVIHLKEGMEIAVVDEEGKSAMWDTIVKIEQTVPEQVYDIEVEGTHNFVGNGIIAHNTVIFGPGEDGTPTPTTIRGAKAFGTDKAGADLTFDASNGTGQGGSGALIFRTAPSSGTSGLTPNTLTEALRIDKDGKVGIGTGTTSPISALHVKGIVRSEDNGFIAISSTSTNGPRRSFTSQNDQNTYLQMEMGSSAQTGNILGLPVANMGYLRLAPATGVSGSPLAIGTGSNGGPLVFATNNQERVRINPVGNVGIGITNPSSTLDVNGQVKIRGGNPAVDKVLTSDAAGLSVWKSLSELGAGGSVGGSANTLADSTIFEDAAGNVGIGTMGPVGTLHIAREEDTRLIVATAGGEGSPSVIDLRRSQGTLASPTDVQNDDNIGTISGTAYSGGSFFSTGGIDFTVDGSFTSGQRPPSRIGFWTNTANNWAVKRMSITKDGNVGIGITDPSSTLDVNGGIEAVLPSGAGDATVKFNTTTKLLSYEASSERLKEKIHDLGFDREKFLQLRPVQFNWKKNKGGKEDIGLIAEEVEKIMPDLIFYAPKKTYVGKDGDVLKDEHGNPVESKAELQVEGVKYDKLPIYLLKIAQEHEQALASLGALGNSTQFIKSADLFSFAGSEDIAKKIAELEEKINVLETAETLSVQTSEAGTGKSGAEQFIIENTATNVTSAQSALLSLSYKDEQSFHGDFFRAMSPSRGKVFSLDKKGNLKTEGNITVGGGTAKICAGGADACPIEFERLTSMGDLGVENDVYAQNVYAVNVFKNAQHDPLLDRRCPTGFVPVPGNVQYGTLDFCVMKYEAKPCTSSAGSPRASDCSGKKETRWQKSGANLFAASYREGLPMRDISQDQAKAACSGLGVEYHLMSEAEWMTIVSNIAHTPLNDLADLPGVQLGNGNSTSDALFEAGSEPLILGCNLNLPLFDEVNAWATGSCELRGTNGNRADFGYSGLLGAVWSREYDPRGGSKAQIRTHVLSNGGVLWDIAGNAAEWTSGVISSQYDQSRMSSNGTAGWIGYFGDETNGYLKNAMGFPVLPDLPRTYSSAKNGIGRMYVRNEAAIAGFVRGGSYTYGVNAGIYSLNVGIAPSVAEEDIGFRCAR